MRVLRLHTACHKCNPPHKALTWQIQVLCVQEVDGLLYRDLTISTVGVLHSRVLGMLEQELCVRWVSRVDAGRQRAVNLRHNRQTQYIHSTAEVPPYRDTPSLQARPSAGQEPPAAHVA